MSDIASVLSEACNTTCKSIAGSDVGALEDLSQSQERKDVAVAVLGHELALDFARRLGLLLRRHVRDVHAHRNRAAELARLAKLAGHLQEGKAEDEGNERREESEEEKKPGRQQQQGEGENEEEEEDDDDDDEDDEEESALASRQREVGRLRQQQLVSCVSSAFRSRLQAIVSVQAGGQAAPPPPPRAAPPPPPPRAAPPPPPRAAPAPAPARQNHDGDHDHDHHHDDVRAADEAFFDQLISPAPAPARAPALQPARRAQASSTRRAGEVAGELHELLTNHVASRVLRSEFRQQLERVLRGHMAQRDLAPVRVGALEPRARPPHPFAQPQPQPQPHQPRPAQQAPRALRQLSHDVEVLQASLADLRLLVDQSMALQADMGRQLSQHVGAALCAVASSNDPQSVLLPGPPLAPAHHEGMCRVCAVQAANAVFFRCGHKCSCVACAGVCKAQRLACPVCRAPVEEFVQAFVV